MLSLLRSRLPVSLRRRVVACMAAAGVLLAFLLAAPVALAQSTGAVSGQVVDAETGDPMSGVNILVVGTQRGTATNAEGRYELALPPGSYTLRASFVGYAARSQPVTVQAGQTSTADFSLQPGSMLDDVVVVGTRGTSRSALESPVPVDAISVEELTASAPQTDLNQLLTYAAPSYQANRQSAADATEFVDPASLRGLYPDQVLVLVNGKRRHKSSLINTLQTAGNGAAGTDLNAIPTGAIERIEILRDGAAAQYGSDAIAGVINLVLKEDTNHLTANVSTGITQEGDGETIELDANYGFDLGDDGFVNVTGAYSNRARTNRTDGNSLIIFDQSAFGNFFAYPPEDSPSNPSEARQIDNQILQDRGLEREDFYFRVGQSAMQNASIFLNAEVGLENNATVYAFGGLTYKNGIGAPFRRLPSETSANVPAIYPNGFQPEMNSDVVDQSLTIGVRGTVEGWTVDLSNSFGRNSLDYQMDNTLNASLLARSPTSIYAGGHAFSQNTANLDVSRLFTDPLAGINVAFGAAYRVDHYEIFAGEEASYRDFGRVQLIEDGMLVTRDTLSKEGGAQGFVGFRPSNEVDRTRNNVAAYADIEFNLTEQFLVTAAGRFEDYSDFGSTLNGKLSARLGLLDDRLGLRGSASTGFRAPSLHQIYFNNVATDLSEGRLVEIGTFSNDSEVARVLGVPRLDEETAVNVSLGVTASPIDNLDITVDGYYIDVQDRVVLTGDFGGDDSAVADLLNEVGAETARFFANAVDTETRGLDVVATYRLDTPIGRFNLSAAGNYNDREAVDLNVPPALEGQEDTFFGAKERTLLEENDPQTKLNLSTDYQTGRFSAFVRVVRFGEVTRNEAPFGEAQVHSPEWVTDLSLGVDLTEVATLTIGANNVFDNYPDEQIFGNSFLGVFDYAPVQQGFNGATYFARLNLAF